MLVPILLALPGKTCMGPCASSSPPFDMLGSSSTPIYSHREPSAYLAQTNQAGHHDEDDTRMRQ
jgi:hypothetical protein